MKVHTTFLLLFLAICSVYAQDLVRVSPGLQQEMEDHPGQKYEVLVVLNEQAPLDNYLDRIRNNPGQRNTIRGEAIRRMQQIAGQTQPALTGWLTGSTSLNNRDIHSYWIVNSMRVVVSAAEIRDIASHPDVRYITLPAIFEEGKTERQTRPPRFDPGTHELGHDVINAPALWKMGYTGYGTKVYVYDTGIDIEHPALRSNFAYHNDPLEISWRGKSDEPYTCNDHGTHVAGTILGLDRERNDTIGVAFNAKYMMSPQFTSCGSSRLDNIEAWQWALDPDGDPLTTEDIPDASNMSGGSRVTDTICGFELFDMLFQGFQIADVGAIFAGGNEGPGDSTHRSPAVHNLDLVHAFAVGNLDAYLLEINNSSSRGPSYCFTTDLSLSIKPEVSAPGTEVRSSVVGGGYDWFTGTSMASPHVAGAFLLLREAFPTLSETQILMALYESATDYGEPGEDNVYGMGVIDVLAAYEQLKNQGFTPVPPLPRKKDLVVVDLGLDQKQYCSTTPFIRVKFENAGLDTVYDVRLDFTESNGNLQSFSKNWSGVLPPDEVTEISFELTDLEVKGIYEMQVGIRIPDNEEEVRLLDNQFKKRFYVYADPDLAVLPKFQEQPSVCFGARTWLKTNITPAGNQNIVWYEGEPSGPPAATGTAFLSPEIYDTTTYFAVLQTEHNTGLSLESTEIEFGEENLGGLVFDADRPFTLKSVRVNAGTLSGGRMIQLYDNEGEAVNSKLVIITQGEQEISLNWRIPQGKGYRMELRSGKPLAHAFEEEAFPIQVDNLVTILSGVYDGEPEANAYYYFFDWKIVSDHPCGAESIELAPGDTDTIPVLDIIPSQDTVYLSEGGSVMLDAAGEGYIEYTWELPNGETFTDQSIVQSFTQEGVYNISLHAKTADGCASGANIEIVVIDDLQTSTNDQQSVERDVQVFPNPARDILYVQYDRFLSAGVAGLNVVVHDLLGRRVINQAFQAQEKIVKLDVSALAPGQYFLRLGGQNKTFMIQ